MFVCVYLSAKKKKIFAIANLKHYTSTGNVKKKIKVAVTWIDVWIIGICFSLLVSYLIYAFYFDTKSICVFVCIFMLQ